MQPAQHFFYCFAIKNIRKKQLIFVILEYVHVKKKSHNLFNFRPANSNATVCKSHCALIIKKKKKKNVETNDWPTVEEN